MTTSTALLLLGCAWAGSLLGLWTAASASVAAGLAAVALLAVPLAALRTPIGRAPKGTDRVEVEGFRPVLVVVAAVAVALTAAAGGAARRDVVQGGALARVLVRPMVVEAHLVPVADVRDPPQGSPWVVARLVDAALPGASQTAAAPAPFATRERVVVRLPERATGGTAVTFGATHRVTGLAQVLESGPASTYFASLGVTVELTAARVEVVRPAPGWQAGTTWLRERVATAAHARLPSAPASLLTGLVTGDVRGQPEDVGDDVTTSGLSHLVAVSGSNVAIVIAGVLAGARLLGLGRRAGWWAALAVVWWFVVLVRAEPSVVRAAVMASLVLATMLVGRVRSAPGLLCTTGIVALLVDPLLAARPGFALSVGATAGVILLAPAIDGALGRHSPIPTAPRLLLSVTLGAQVAVAPVLLGIGGLVHPASVPANLVAVPAAAVASAVGGLVAVLATVAPGVAGVAAVAARPPLEVVLWSARTFASPGGQRASTWGCVAIFVVVAVAGWRRLPPAPRRVLPALGLALAVVAIGLPGRGTRPGGLPPLPTLVALDVGQGDALLLGDPSAGWVLVDGGPDPERLARALDDVGVTELAAVVVSHPHADHTEGLIDLLPRMEVGALVVGPTGEDAVEVLAAARGAGVAVVTAAAGDGWQHGALRLAVLSPPPTGLGDEPNDNSLVLRVDVEGGRSALLTGDAEVLAQLRLAADPTTAALLDVDVLKVPHHGGATNAPGFVAATSPAQALISVGARNGFGHPHPDVLADLEGVAVGRTDLDGTVTVPLAAP